MDEKYKLDTPIRIHFTGCPNSCGQKHIADISLQGALIKTDSGSEEAFTLWIGGSLLEEGRFAENINYRVSADRVHLTIEKIVLFYVDNRLDKETFYDFVQRVGIDEIKKEL
jgi:ferredoxin-nitrite reductase